VQYRVPNAGEAECSMMGYEPGAALREAWVPAIDESGIDRWTNADGNGFIE
jgi:hypothetical protein